eukprot:gene11119-12956_t
MTTTTNQASAKFDATECHSVLPLPPSHSAASSSFREVGKDILASIVGSALCIYSGQPFDTLKVRLQVQTSNAEGAFQLLKRSIATEGVRSLWKGSVPAFSGALAENAMAFATNGFMNRLLAPFIEPGEEGQIHCKGPILSGAVTGALTSVVLAPFDILKCRAQMAIAQGNVSPSMSTTALNLYRAQGLKGFYVGYGAQLMREIPFFALFFGSYEISCQLLRKHTKMHDSTIYITSGGLAGQVAWAGTMAADSVKSVIQTATNPLSIRATARNIYTQKGLAGFYAGLGVVLIRAFPANAALFVGYEYTKKVLE